MIQEIDNGISGVYLIQCIENGKNYIGSAKCIRKRWLAHINDLSKNKHHSIKLQGDWIKYGSEKFEFKVLRECSHADSKKYEMEYIKLFNSEKFGYNVIDFKESSKKKSEFAKKIIFNYVIKNGYESDGNTYFFSIFDLSNEINMSVTDILKFFGVNKYKRWDISYEISKDIYAGISYDGADGVQIVAFHKSFLEKDSSEVEFIKCF